MLIAGATGTVSPVGLAAEPRAEVSGSRTSHRPIIAAAAIKAKLAHLAAGALGMLGVRHRQSSARLDPDAGKYQSRAGVDEAGGDPHPETCQLLVLERSETPEPCVGRVGRVPEIRGQNQEHTQKTGVESGEEQMHHP